MQQYNLCNNTTYAQDNLPWAGFELRFLELQARRLPIEPPLLVHYSVSSKKKLHNYLICSVLCSSDSKVVLDINLVHGVDVSYWLSVQKESHPQDPKLSGLNYLPGP